MSGFVTFVATAVLGALQAASPDRPDLGEPQVKALREKNIFAPFRTKPWPDKKPDPGPTPGPTGGAAPSKPKPLVLTGIVYDEASKTFQAVVEDKSDEKVRRLEKPRFLKAGEEVLGVKIELVEKDKVTVVLGETRKDLAPGDPIGDAPEGTPGAPAVESKPAEPGVVNSVLEELKKKNKKKDRSYGEP